MEVIRREVVGLKVTFGLQQRIPQVLGALQGFKMLREVRGEARQIP
jgi:hypothetical protein